jgi:hypothetical protein
MATDQFRALTRRERNEAASVLRESAARCESVARHLQDDATAVKIARRALRLERVADLLSPPKAATLTALAARPTREG